MADTLDSPFVVVLKRLLADRTNGVSSQRLLAARVAAIKGTDGESERRTVARHYHGDNEPEEKSIAAYAEAFGVPRDTFPEAADPRARSRHELARKAVSIEKALANITRLERRLQRGAGDDPQVRDEADRILRELEATAAAARELRKTLEAAPRRSGARAAASGDGR